MELSIIPPYTHEIWNTPENIKSRCWTFISEKVISPHFYDKHSTIQYIGSKTALYVCMWRAIAYGLGFGPDLFANLFVNTHNLRRIKRIIDHFKETSCLPIEYSIGNHEAVIAKQLSNPLDEVDMLSYIQTRTCFFDDVVTRFTKENMLSNIVIIGAGFDSRFYRLPFTDNIKLYEIDHPNTQLFKKSVLQKVIDTSHITYLPVDLSKESLFKNLELNDFNNTNPTLFIAEGVFPYIDSSKVEKLLFDINNIEAPTIIVFDFVAPGFMANRKVRESLDKISEPWLFDIDFKTISTICTRVGLTIIDTLSVFNGLERYMPIHPMGYRMGYGSKETRFIVATNRMFRRTI